MPCHAMSCHVLSCHVGLDTPNASRSTVAACEAADEWERALRLASELNDMGIAGWSSAILAEHKGKKVKREQRVQVVGR